MRIAFLILSCWLTACITESPQDTSTVSGSVVVIDPVTGSPDWHADLNGTVVSIEGTDITATTAVDGRFTLSDVPSGKHTYLFARPSYGTQTMFDVEAAEVSDRRLIYLYSLNDYAAEITAIARADTLVTKTVQVDVLVSPNGDTLSRGHDSTFSELEKGYAVIIEGKLHLPSRQKVSQPHLYLIASARPELSISDPQSWNALWSADYQSEQMSVTDSTFEIRIYEQEKGYLSNYFLKDQPVYFAIYASPGFCSTLGLTGRTAHIFRMMDNKTYFPVFAKSAASPVSFSYPW